MPSKQTKLSRTSKVNGSRTAQHLKGTFTLEGETWSVPSQGAALG